MRTKVGHPRGVLLMELMVTIGIIGIVATLAYSSIRLQRPRARLVTTAAEVHSLLHASRLSAMDAGRPRVVMIFPDFVNLEGGTGRIVVYDDGAFSFFNPAAAVNLDNFDPAALRGEAATATTPGGRVTQVLDFPEGTVMGPVAGMGVGFRLAAPYASIPVDTACSFCGGAPVRGAIAFDAAGHATFYNAAGVPLAGAGHSFSLTNAELAAARTRTLVVTAGSGAVRTFLSD